MAMGMGWTSLVATGWWKRRRVNLLAGVFYLRCGARLSGPVDSIELH